MTNLKVGVVGYSSQSFDANKAKRLIKEAFDKVAAENPNRQITVVSGLTDLGIPAVAYREAKRRGWRTAGVACKKANDYALFSVDEKKIVGDNWGDESSTFLREIEILIRVGGGKQSHEETRQARSSGKTVLEYELAAQ